TPVLETHQVLVQRESINPLADTLDSVFVSNLEQLAGKEIHVRTESSFYDRLMEIQKETNLNFEITPAGNKSTEQLIKSVSTRGIDYTVADQNVALLNYSYYPNLDINLVLSESQNVGWAV